MRPAFISPLFVFRILAADDIDVSSALASYTLATVTQLFDAAPNFHSTDLLSGDYLASLDIVDS